VTTLPKRKLPRLWYSKNSYKKERENEADKINEPIQENNTIQPFSNEQNSAPVEIDNRIQPIETDNDSLSIQNSNQSKQTENKSTETTSVNENNLQLSETQSPLNDSELKSINELKEQQNEPDNNPAQTQNLAQDTSVEIENKPHPTEKETLETMQIAKVVPAINEVAEIIEAPNEPENKEIMTETKATATQAPNQIANKEVIVETNIEPIVEEAKELSAADAENKVPLTDSVVNIEKYTDTLKRLLPTKAIVCIGEYTINIVLKGSFGDKKGEGVLPIFVEKSTQDVIKWSQGRLDDDNIVCIDEDVNTHFWYDILPFVVNNEGFFAKIKNKPLEKIQSAIMVSSSWTGIGSALLPTLTSQFKELNVNSIALPILPSKAQPLDNQFNTFASIGLLASKDSTVLLVDRDNLENYKGVDRNGFAINGNTVLNYLLDLTLAKPTFVQELCELSNSFDTRMFTTLLASGASLKIYDSIENMLNTTLLRPLLNFDLSSATLLYVLIRMPFHLKDKIPRGKLELAIDNWFKDKANLESIYITDPIYVEDFGDRIDIALFVGGFETITRFASLEKRIMKIKNQAVKKGLITEEKWQVIAKSLIK